MAKENQETNNQRRPLATTSGEYLSHHGPRTYDHTDKVSDSEQKRKRQQQPYHDQEFYPLVESPERKGRIHSRKNQTLMTKHLGVGIVGEHRLPYFEVWYDDPQRLNDGGGTQSPTTGCYRAVFRAKDGSDLLEISPDNGIIVTCNGKAYDMCAVLTALDNAGLI